MARSRRRAGEGRSARAQSRRTQARDRAVRAHGLAQPALGAGGQTDRTPSRCTRALRAGAKPHLALYSTARLLRRRIDLISVFVF
ncbi:hypothetical protein GUJ93_ZPchr0006g45145 [Zizania palustris]|uniref:Uncharacterized protein n=1 Tax=Zizania palustris TaxID=103762 RepID=A0A8J5VQA8_ZIZPA|nr:hypothetical protein GUJ93_ZPchr0006g45145 [Zizania palustris]